MISVALQNTISDAKKDKRFIEESWVLNQGKPRGVCVNLDVKSGETAHQRMMVKEIQPV